MLGIFWCLPFGGHRDAFLLAVYVGVGHRPCIRSAVVDTAKPFAKALAGHDVVVLGDKNGGGHFVSDFPF